MILVVNKWDLVPQDYKKKVVKYMENQISKKLSEVSGIKLFCISAKTGQNLDNLMDEVIQIYDKWNIRVTTA